MFAGKSAWIGTVIKSEGKGEEVMSIIIVVMPKVEDAKKIRRILVSHGFTDTVFCPTGAGALIEINKYSSGLGIQVDAIVTSQLLINIFEHNTPLHDGAVIIRGNRVTSATCYLPLSDNMELSKELGTRHRAGVGISEVTDSMTIIVSEETGKVSIAENGKLSRAVTEDELRKYLMVTQDKSVESQKFKLWKGKGKG